MTRKHVDRLFQMPLSRVFAIVLALREEAGATGWAVRGILADSLGSSPTADDVRAFIESELKRRVGGADEDWAEVAWVEAPIAEFLSLWDDAGARCAELAWVDGNLRWSPHRWLVTPTKYHR